MSDQTAKLRHCPSMTQGSTPRQALSRDRAHERHTTNRCRWMNIHTETHKTICPLQVKPARPFSDHISKASLATR